MFTGLLIRRLKNWGMWVHVARPSKSAKEAAVGLQQETQLKEESFASESSQVCPRHFGTVLSLRTSSSPEDLTLFDLLDSGSVRLPSLPRFVRSPPRPTPLRVLTPRALPDLASASWTTRSDAFGMG